MISVWKKEYLLKARKRRVITQEQRKNLKPPCYTSRGLERELRAKSR